MTISSATLRLQVGDAVAGVVVVVFGFHPDDFATTSNFSQCSAHSGNTDFTENNKGSYKNFDLSKIKAKATSVFIFDANPVNKIRYDIRCSYSHSTARQCNEQSQKYKKGIKLVSC